jgi:copper chaperone CopZ
MQFVHNKLESESHLWAQVVELKVGMHCERCIRAIKKAIKTIDGKACGQLCSFSPNTIQSFTFSPLTVRAQMGGADMESYHLETEINKVTVTGNVTSEEVVKALHKIGKTATCWAEG